MNDTSHYGKVGALKSYQYEYKQNYVLISVPAVRRDFLDVCQCKPLGTHCTHYVGDWVNPRACLDAVDKRKILILPEPSRGRSCHSPSLYQLSYTGSAFVSYISVSNIFLLSIPH
jgi:hypothetical protein